jgi:hypothetical protein
MAAHGDESFVPFVPRQLKRMSDEPQEREQSHVPVNDTASQESEPKAKLETEVEAQAKSETQPSTVQVAAVGVRTEVAQPSICDHALEIRHEAIRLAAIACGRALRHAVLLHPGVIAAFVDDAMAAAGLPQHARIRVHPASIAYIAAPHHDRIGDDTLPLGDVEVESNGVTLGADTDTRAGLLVNAAAEA